MSDYTAIRGVSRTLQSILRDHITNDPDPQLNNVAIELLSPKEMREEQINGISVWLYKVGRNEHLLNQPPPRIPTSQVLRNQLPMNLYYLITPLRDEPDNEQALLGRVLQTFNDHNHIRGADLQDSLQDGPEELHITLEQLTLEELTRIWESLQEPYQLSVTYLVQLISIESAHDPLRTSPVIQKETTIGEIVGVQILE